MEIIGIGTEIVECLHIGKMIEEHGELFLRRVYTEKEIRFCQSRRHPTEHFAARWAAKEAVLKSLRSANSKGTARNEVEISCDDSGISSAQFLGALRDAAETLDVADIELSTSFTRAYATATAIALRRSA